MPSSQEIARLVEEHLRATKWQQLADAISLALEKQFPEMPVSLRSELVEEHAGYVEEILRESRALQIDDGGIPTFELDKRDPYIRRINEKHTLLASKLRRLDPFYFEVVCRRILEKLGGTAENTQRTNDGGVDFFALDLPPLSSGFPVPRTAALTVIGQAKRYAENNEVTETEIRKFLGGAMLKQDELRKENKIRVLSPVFYAFWTTSDLHANARTFSQKMGIWHLDGLALSEYIMRLDLEEEVFRHQEDDNAGMPGV